MSSPLDNKIKFFFSLKYYEMNCYDNIICLKICKYRILWFIKYIIFITYIIYVYKYNFPFIWTTLCWNLNNVTHLLLSTPDATNATTAES